MSVGLKTTERMAEAAGQLRRIAAALDGELCLELTEQRAVDAAAREQAAKIVAAQDCLTLEEAEQLCTSWVVTAMQHLRNESYWRERALRAEQELQRRSFAHGNTALSNPNVTREMTDQEAEKLKGGSRNE